MIERQKAHYEVAEVPYGKVYSWRPEYVCIECDCGETLTWRGEASVCGCGASYTGEVREMDDLDAGEDQHPWFEEHRAWREEKVANNLRHEYYEFVGVRDGG